MADEEMDDVFVDNTSRDIDPIAEACPSDYDEVLFRHPVIPMLDALGGSTALRFVHGTSAASRDAAQAPRPASFSFQCAVGAVRAARERADPQHDPERRMSSIRPVNSICRAGVAPEASEGGLKCDVE